MSEQVQTREIIYPKPIEDEIKQSYIDYAMSVIVSRALPDVRDGLKPVQRRILYAMYREGLLSNKKHAKSAAVVGEVLKKYHPHGDSSVYDAMVRMAQPWNMRYPLIDWQGNFGSIDGDGPAAQRYTEARLTPIAEEMLRDIDLDTVDWQDNYDGSTKEPKFLPTRFPNHLANWTMGIAVGMATNMAPHNLGEIIDALKLLISNPDATIDEIMEIIKGPDFPTWGIIFDPEQIKRVYARWKWWIVVRGKVNIEEGKGGTQKIVITEIPYQVNKASLVAKIGLLVQQKKLEGVADITDESNKDQIRITISLKKWVNPQNILTLLYKYTDLQTTFNINNVILIEGGLQPALLNIRDLLWEFVEFRRNVVLRRSKYLLGKAKERLHILEGLQKAVDILDDVIATIRASQTRAEAKEQLMKKFDFTDPQAEYILMLRLQTLVGMELQKIIDEIDERKKQIAELEDIIANPASLDKVVVEELDEIKQKYADPRRTEVMDDPGVYDLETKIKKLKSAKDAFKEKVIVHIDSQFRIRVLYQSRINAIPDDTLEIIHTHNQDKLIVITSKGEIISKRLKDLGSFSIKSTPLDLKEKFGLEGEIVYVGTLEKKFDYIVMLTNKNNIKKVTKNLVASLKKTPTTIMKLDEDERIIKAIDVEEGDTIVIVTKKGMILLFKESQIRASGKTAWGVKAVDLEPGDEVADMTKNQGEMFIFVHSQKGGKLIALEDLKVQKRAQRWLVAATLKEGEEIRGVLSVDDGAVTLRYKDGSLAKVHSNDVKLKTRYAWLDKVSEREIERVFRPWEEKLERGGSSEEEPKKSEEEGRKAEEYLKKFGKGLL